jgi:phage head-tail adaptor, putative, SPP1 family
MDGVAYLIQMRYKSDKIGQSISSEEKRKIYVSERALTRTEYFKAGQNGMNPGIILTTAAVNYSEESIIEYEDVRYGIYRTYHKLDSDEIELYLHKQAGT